MKKHAFIIVLMISVVTMLGTMAYNTATKPVIDKSIQHMLYDKGAKFLYSRHTKDSTYWLYEMPGGTYHTISQHN